MLFSWIGVAPSLYKLRETLLFEDLNQINWCIVFSYLVPSIKKIDDVFKLQSVIFLTKFKYTYQELKPAFLGQFWTSH